MSKQQSNESRDVNDVEFKQLEKRNGDNFKSQLELIEQTLLDKVDSKLKGLQEDFTKLEKEFDTFSKRLNTLDKLDKKVEGIGYDCKKLQGQFEQLQNSVNTFNKKISTLDNPTNANRSKNRDDSRNQAHFDLPTVAVVIVTLLAILAGVIYVFSMYF